MLRTAALRMGKGLAVAGTASAAQPRVAGADARTPHAPALPRATKPKEGVQEEAWLEVALGEDGVIFSPFEIEDTVEEIIGLCDDMTQYEAVDAGNESEAPESQAQTEESHFLKDVLRASQRMVKAFRLDGSSCLLCHDQVSHPKVQSAAMVAVQDDEGLRRMIEDLGNCHLTPTEDATPVIEVEAPVNRGHRNNPMLTMFEDITHHLGRLARAVQGACGRSAVLFRNVISRMVGSLKKAAGEIDKVAGEATEAVLSVFPSTAKFFREAGPAGKAGSLVAACAMLLVVVMIVKRRIA